MNKSLSYAYAGIVLTTFFWGSNFNAGAYIIQHMPPITTAAERFVVASVALLLIFTASGHLRWSALRQNLLAYALIGILGVVGFNMAMFYGLHTTSAINGALIMATTPLSTMLLAWLLEGEKLTINKGFGLLFGLAGVLLVITHGQLLHVLHLKIAIGDIILLGGSISFALASILSRKLVKNATALETTSFSMLFGTVALAALSLGIEQPFTAMAHAPLMVHVALLYLAVFGSMVAYLFWFNGIQKVGASRAAVFFNLVPVFSMLVAILFGSLPDLWQILGTLLVISGVVISTGILSLHFPQAIAAKS